MNIPGDSPPPCPKCNSDNSRTWNLFGANVAKPGSFIGTSSVQALVCLNCGYTELYAKNPENLLPKPKKDRKR